MVTQCAPGVSRGAQCLSLPSPPLPFRSSSTAWTGAPLPLSPRNPSLPPPKGASVPRDLPGPSGVQQPRVRVLSPRPPAPEDSAQTAASDPPGKAQGLAAVLA